MLDVLIDDIADEHGDLELLERLVSLPDGVSIDAARYGERAPYVELTIEVWQEVQSRVRDLPRHTEFARLLRYDYRQLMNTMRYAHLLNEHPALLNLAEHDLYLPHNMHMMVSATMDVMASESFAAEEIGLLREAIWHAQYMGRIGNLVTTWKREIGQGDFTSGVFAHAVVAGRLQVSDFENLTPDVLETLIEQGGHEEYFLERWQRHRAAVLSLSDRVHSVDLRELVCGLERLICLHLASRGKK